jgi:hypothetical protein
MHARNLLLQVNYNAKFLNAINSKGIDEHPNHTTRGSKTFEVFKTLIENCLVNTTIHLTTLSKYTYPTTAKQADLTSSEIIQLQKQVSLSITDMIDRIICSLQA